MKPRSKKAKGTKLEKLVESFFQSIGWKARRQPGSGIYDSFPHDVYAEHPELGPLLIECKKHKRPWATGDRWLGKADALVVQADNEPAYIYMKLSTFGQLVAYGPVEAGE